MSKGNQRLGDPLDIPPEIRTLRQKEDPGSGDEVPSNVLVSEKHDTSKTHNINPANKNHVKDQEGPSSYEGISSLSARNYGSSSGFTVAGKSEYKSKTNVEAPTIRENDTGLGQPDFAPDSEEKKNMKWVDDEEINRLRQEQDDMSKLFQQKLRELEKTGIKIPAFLYRFVLWFMLFVIAFMGIFLLNQMVRFWSEVSSLTAPWNIVASSFFILFLTLLFGVLFKISLSFLKYRKLARIDIKALNILAQRREFQLLAQNKKDEAMKILTEYLTEYHTVNSEDSLPGMDKKQMERLKAFRTSLMDKSGYMNSTEWLKEFEESFIYTLDLATRKRIRAYARNVAVGTAASPIKFIDQMIVLYASLRLISEIMQIYSLRPAAGQSTVVLFRAIIQAYLSGVIGEQTEAGVEAFSEYYESIFGEISFAAGMSAVTDATRFMLPKVSEGALNGFLIWRLGRQAQRMVRPVGRG